MDIKIDLHQHLSNCLNSYCDMIWSFFLWNNSKISVFTLSSSHVFWLFRFKDHITGYSHFSSVRIRTSVSLACHKHPNFQSAWSVMMPGDLVVVTSLLELKNPFPGCLIVIQGKTPKPFSWSPSISPLEGIESSHFSQSLCEACLKFMQRITASAASCFWYYFSVAGGF